MQIETKRTWVAILISDKIGFKPKMVKRDRDGHCIVIRRSIHQEDTKIINIYAPNYRTPELC